MAHLIVVFSICVALGAASGSPGIAYLAMCVEVFVSLRHAAAWHGGTLFGRVGHNVNDQALVFVQFLGLVAIHHFWTHVIDAPWFWFFGTIIGGMVGLGSYFWHKGAHPQGRRSWSSSQVYGYQLAAVMCLFFAALGAVLAPTFPLTASPP